MEPLYLEASASTPRVAFDPATGRLGIHGESYPENAFEFFRPILRWVEDFLRQEAPPLALELGLSYMNTSSIKNMMDLLDLLEEAHRAGRQVTLTWYYDEENDRALELAEEFREEVTLPFFVVPQPSERETP